MCILYTQQSHHYKTLQPISYFFHFSALPIIFLNYCTQIHVCFFRTWRVNKSRLAYETSSNLLWFNSMRIQKSLGTMPVLAQLILLHFGPSKALVGVVQPQLFPKVHFETCHFTKKNLVNFSVLFNWISNFFWKNFCNFFFTFSVKYHTSSIFGK
jgi:hypothetical protein